MKAIDMVKIDNVLGETFGVERKTKKELEKSKKQINKNKKVWLQLEHWRKASICLFCKTTTKLFTFHFLSFFLFSCFLIIFRECTLIPHGLPLR